LWLESNESVAPGKIVAHQSEHLQIAEFLILKHGDSLVGVWSGDERLGKTFGVSGEPAKARVGEIVFIV
jgi:hypothetical protein